MDDNMPIARAEYQITDDLYLSVLDGSFCILVRDREVYKTDRWVVAHLPRNDAQRLCDLLQHELNVER